MLTGGLVLRVGESKQVGVEDEEPLLHLLTMTRLMAKVTKGEASAHCKILLAPTRPFLYSEATLVISKVNGRSRGREGPLSRRPIRISAPFEEGHRVQ